MNSTEYDQLHHLITEIFAANRSFQRLMIYTLPLAIVIFALIVFQLFTLSSDYRARDAELRDQVINDIKKLESSLSELQYKFERLDFDRDEIDATLTQLNISAKAISELREEILASGETLKREIELLNARLKKLEDSPDGGQQ